jgi:hypothetical protein
MWRPKHVEGEWGKVVPTPPPYMMPTAYLMLVFGGASRGGPGPLIWMRCCPDCFDCIHAHARGQLIDIISQHNICNPAGSDLRIPAWGTLEYHLALTLLLETLTCLYSAFSYLIAIMRIPQYSPLF